MWNVKIIRELLEATLMTPVSITGIRPVPVKLTGFDCAETLLVDLGDGTRHMVIRDDDGDLAVLDPAHLEHRRRYYREAASRIGEVLALYERGADAAAPRPT